MSLQVCSCCGWSKVTTYHGLRTHQGKMGCTPKGMSIPQSQQFSFLPKITHQTPLTHLQTSTGGFAKTPVKSEHLSLQVCHCGWSKETTYQGLRIHQGKMGCTPQGIRIPEREQYLWRNPWVTSHLKYNNPISAPIKKEDDRRSIKHGENHHKAGHVVDLKPQLQIFATQRNSPSLQTPVKDSNKSFSGTLPLSFQGFRKASEKAQRKLDFSTGMLKVRQNNVLADLQQKILKKKQKMAEVTSSVKSYQDRLDSEWMEINDVFAEVIRVVEDVRDKALDPVEIRRQKVKREAASLLDELQKEIDRLEDSVDELDDNLVLQTSFLPDTDDSNWENVNVDTSFSFGSLRAATSAMMKDIQKKLEDLSSLELKRISTFAVDVKLDSATAHHCLVLSDDKKKVRDGGMKPTLPDTPERFDTFGSILGINIVTSGKSYWEVEVFNKTGWDLGVARRKANRKGILSLNSDNGYWVTTHYEDEKYSALSVPPISLPLKQKPQKVGVFVDYEEGLVSFYDVMSRSHIYSFTECSFRDEIVPYFSPHLTVDNKNADPLVISAVQKQQL